MTPTPETDQWEAYCDEWYYHMWRLRRKTERGWHDGFHIHTGDEAKGLCDLLNNLERELTAVTKERDEAREQRDTLEDLVKQFIYILDITEESDGGRLFHPTNITSCRAGDLQKINELVEALRRASTNQPTESISNQ